MSKKCPYCGSIRVATSPSGDVSVCLACESFLNTVNGKSKQTVFDRITASPEVLAEKLVYEDFGGWWSVLFDDDCNWDSRDEAIAATLEELNKVEE